MRTLILSFFVSLFVINTFAQKQFILESPNRKLVVKINIGDRVDYQVDCDEDVIIENSPISMTLGGQMKWGITPKLIGKENVSIDEFITATIYKKSRVRNHYNELRLKFRGNYHIVFRAYDESVAYRFESKMNKSFVVEDEQVVFNFPNDHAAFIPYVKCSGGFDTFEAQLNNPFENIYTHCKLSEWDGHRLALTPVMVESAKGKKVVITEADLLDYPGMYLCNKEQGKSITGYFAAYPDKVEQSKYDYREENVLTRKNYIAECKGQTNFPWRIITISDSDKELLDNDIVYKLATPSSDDFSWVKPGKVAWDWWNSLNVYGVDFKTGINTVTYKKYIDFASANGLEYIIMDEGWSDGTDLYKIIPQIDLDELVAYGKIKGVGIILWLPYYGFSFDIEGICKHYSEKGIKGFKIDFMDRDDQLMVRFHRYTAEVAAKYQLLIDYHGTYKPTGLQRTYPNVLNFEGVFGLENCKWADKSYDMVVYDVTFPFIRQIAGPADYTPGAMRNAIQNEYHPVFERPISQGTRCRQLALYLVLEAPLNMLCDSPTDYEKEQECTDFIAAIPTVWDETFALGGKVGEYISIARRKDAVWYAAALTDWNKREVEFDLSFLGEGKYKAEVFCDGVNADRVASDYTRKIVEIPVNKKIKEFLMPGGGCILKIWKTDN